MPGAAISCSSCVRSCLRALVRLDAQALAGADAHVVAVRFEHVLRFMVALVGMLCQAGRHGRPPRPRLVAAAMVAMVAACDQPGRLVARAARSDRMVGEIRGR